eukprot:TRINITY_DN1932_c0_g1_i2.p1 TRINITY_DN1932_c0_g1~~TRINITY_DN1932_c0_g1_i2.p1  ORF type:complete len:275 (+),score=48.14 TRINITY_DN1932_c0_g1_i2:161-985(+)
MEEGNVSGSPKSPESRFQSMLSTNYVDTVTRRKNFSKSVNFSRSWAATTFTPILTESLGNIARASSLNTSGDKYLTADDLALGHNLISRTQSGTVLKHPLLVEPSAASKPRSAVSGRRKFIPNDLAKFRDQANKQLRPFLEHVNSYISSVCGPLDFNVNIAVLKKLKQLALDFLFSSEEELQQGACTNIIKDLQNVEIDFGTRFNPESIEKELIIRLLFILSNYSRVQEYLSNMSSYMTTVMDGLKDLAIKDGMSLYVIVDWIVEQPGNVGHRG